MTHAQIPTPPPPSFEYELVNGQRTGRKRTRQFVPTKRCLAVPPSKRVAEPFV